MEEEVIEEVIYEDENPEIIDKKSKKRKEPKPVKQKQIWWRVLLAFFGGFFAFPIVLGVVIAVVLSNIKVDDIVRMTGNDPEQVLGEQYQNKNILEFVTQLTKANFNDLEGLNSITPMVERMIVGYEDENGNMVGGLNETLYETIGVKLDWDTLKTKTFNGSGDDNIGVYLQNYLLDNVTIVHFMENTDDMPNIYNYFLYDVERDENGKPKKTDGHYNVDMNHPTVLSQLLDGDFLGGIIDYVSIKDIVGDEDAGLLNAIKDFTIEDLQDEEKILGLYVHDIFDDLDSESFLYNFKDKTLKQLTNLGVDTLLLKDVFSESYRNSTPIIKAIYDKDHDITIGDMLKYETISDIELGEIIPEENYKDEIGNVTNKLLKAMIDNHTTIDNISEKVDELKISDVLNISDSAPKVLITLRDYDNIDGSKGAKLKDLETIMGTLKLNEIIEIDEGSSSTAQILKSLANTTVFGSGTDNLVYKLNHLKFNEVFTESECTGPSASKVIKILWEKDGRNGNFDIFSIPSEVSGITLVDLLGDDLYENPTDPIHPNRIDYTWWFLLTSEDDYIEWESSSEGLARIAAREQLGEGLNYTVNSLDDLVDNISYHVDHEVLDTLYAAGFLSISDPAMLDNDFGYGRIGDMTIAGFIEAIDTYLSMLP